jgi:histidinol phosphatase-like PHP family hydrolase
MTDQEKAINEVLEGIEIEILNMQKLEPEEENGFLEALRLCRASVRARYIEEDADDE